MIILADSLPDGCALSADAAVVGAGPAGIAVALEAAARGLDVVLIESGYDAVSPAVQELAQASAWDASLHAPMAQSVRRQLGGTSTVWGGRCVPYDRVDLERRDFIGDVSWPVAYDELSRYFQRASDWLGCGRPAFDQAQMRHLPPAIVPGLTDAAARTSTFERWTLSPNFAVRYGATLRQSPRVRVITGLTCTGVTTDSDGALRAESLTGRTLAGKRMTITARAYVLACGGIESTRLLLASRDTAGHPIGDHSGHLGRWYMGHVGGVIARVRFLTPPRATVYGFETDIDGTPVRRRFSIPSAVQLEYEMPNTIAFLANPEMANPRHRNGILSLAHVVLHSPLGEAIAPAAHRAGKSPGDGRDEGNDDSLPAGKVSRMHYANIVRDLPAVSSFALSSGMRRLRSRGHQAPGLFTAYSAENCYPLQYHGEQVPNRASRVTLAEDRDAVGMPRVKIDLRFSPRDVAGTIRCHEAWDKYLRDSGCGRLEYLSQDLAQAIQAQFGAGSHQLGTTRMSARPCDGVVDRELAVHGFRNLFVASSSALPTAGQANPTFMVMVMALRLADHLGSLLGLFMRASTEPSARGRAGR